MKYVIGVIGVLILGLVILLGANYGGERIQPEFDREGQYIKVYIEFYDTESELMDAIAPWNPDDIPHKGMAGWSLDENYCYLFSLKPQYVDDDHTMTVGHELLHCVYGQYHR